MTKVSVVVCTLNREEELRNFLTTLRAQTFNDYELLIVSNKQMRVPGAKVIVQKGRGLPNARNEALPHVKGDVIAFFDDDVLLDKDYLEEVVRVFERDAGIGGVMGKVISRKDDEIKSGLLGKFMKAYARLFGISGFFVNIDGVGRILPSGFTCSNFDQVTHEIEVDWLGGACMSYRKAAIVKTGKFNEKLIGNAYYEDTDYSSRVRRNGYKLICTPQAVVQHLMTPTSRESLPKLKYNQLYNHRIFFYDNVYAGSLWRKLRYRTARAALIIPVIFYSAYFGSLNLLKYYVRALLS